MWESVRRSVSLILSNDFEKTLTKLSYDDTFGVSEKLLEEVLQTLLGANKQTTVSDALQIIYTRMQKCRTWRVYLKLLILIQHVLIAPQTTVSWLQYFLSDLGILQFCEKFRATEDSQAGSHAGIVRDFAMFLNVYSCQMLQPFSVLSKLQSLNVIPQLAKEQETGVLLRNIHLAYAITAASLNVFVKGGNFVVPYGFCDLTACVLRHLLKEILKLYGLLSMLIIEMLDRMKTLEESEACTATLAYEGFLAASEDLLRYCDFIRTLPGIDADSIPVLDMPSTDPLFVLQPGYPHPRSTSVSPSYSTFRPIDSGVAGILVSFSSVSCVVDEVGAEHLPEDMARRRQSWGARRHLNTSVQSSRVSLGEVLHKLEAGDGRNGGDGRRKKPEEERGDANGQRESGIGDGPNNRDCFGSERYDRNNIIYSGTTTTPTSWDGSKEDGNVFRIGVGESHNEDNGIATSRGCLSSCLPSSNSGYTSYHIYEDDDSATSSHTTSRSLSKSTKDGTSGKFHQEIDRARSSNESRSQRCTNNATRTTKPTTRSTDGMGPTNSTSSSRRLTTQYSSDCQDGTNGCISNNSREKVFHYRWSENTGTPANTVRTIGRSSDDLGATLENKKVQKSSTTKV